MNYELIITRTQPPCGGKETRTHEIRSVNTDDVIAYVRACESDMPADAPLTASDDGKGTVTVEFKSGAETITYEFTED
ncbi:MAG: hypothetical protein IJT62_04050 [Oscillospiraceae bacterium]|nr:hypothetical protein [Oscillospiraceae bacterium]